MLIIGLLLFFIAAYDGATFNDRYPEYHSKSLRFIDAFQAYETSMLRTMASIKAQSATFVKDIEKI